MKNGLNTRKNNFLPRVLPAIVLAVIMCLGICASSLTAYAATGTITASSARIRSEASTDSDVVGSVTAGTSVTVNSSVTGSDGYTWYQVVVDANTVGYIRSDLITVSGTVEGEEEATYNPTVEITAVETISAAVTGSDQVRVRGDASSSSSILTQLSADTEVTISGYATGDDGYTWYRVMFYEDNEVVTGFIREDFLTFTDELVPTDESGDSREGEDGQGDGSTTTTQLYAVTQGTDEDGNECWYLTDYTTGTQYEITSLLDSAQLSSVQLSNAQKTVKHQRTAIVILVIILVVAVLGVVFLIFKVKDVMDEAYFAAVEKRTMQERSEARRKRMEDSPSASAKTGRAQESGALKSGQNKDRTASQTKNGSAQPRNTQAGAGTRTGSQGAARTGSQGVARTGSQTRTSENSARTGQGTARTGSQTRTGESTVRTGQTRNTNQTRTAEGTTRAGGQGATHTGNQTRTASQVRTGEGVTRQTARPATQSQEADGARQAVRAAQNRSVDNASAQSAPKRPESTERAVTSTSGAAEDDVKIAGKPGKAESRGEQSQNTAQGNVQTNVQTNTQKAKPAEKAKTARGALDEDDEFDFEFLNWDEDEN